jgi:hypothetical protein
MFEIVGMPLTAKELTGSNDHIIQSTDSYKIPRCSLQMNTDRPIQFKSQF